MLELRVGNEISRAEKQRVLALGKDDRRDLSDVWQSSVSVKQGLGPGLCSFVSELLSASLQGWKGESGELSTAGVCSWRATKCGGFWSQRRISVRNEMLK